jgi:hypothetical protein
MQENYFDKREGGDGKILRVTQVHNQGIQTDDIPEPEPVVPEEPPTLAKPKFKDDRKLSPLIDPVVLSYMGMKEKENEQPEDGQEESESAAQGTKRAAHFPLEPPVLPDPDIPHDWTETELFKRCEGLRRLVKPSLENTGENQIISMITQMRANPQGYRRAHVLMPIFETAIEYLEDLLVT